MQRIQIALTNKERKFNDYKQRDAVATMVRIHAKHTSEAGFYFNEFGDDVLIMEFVFALKSDAERLAATFKNVPEWLQVFDIVPAYFCGGWFCVTWDEEIN